MSKISPCLWFNGDAEEAANFYVSLLPGSKIDNVARNSADGPGGKAGTVLVVEFTVAGQHFMAINGGMKVEYTHAVSFKIDCADQAEVDHLWDALLAAAARKAAAAGSPTATACPGRSYRPRCRNTSAAPTRPAQAAP